MVLRGGASHFPCDIRHTPRDIKSPMSSSRYQIWMAANQKALVLEDTTDIKFRLEDELADKLGCRLDIKFGRRSALPLRANRHACQIWDVPWYEF